MITENLVNVHCFIQKRMKHLVLRSNNGRVETSKSLHKKILRNTILGAAEFCFIFDYSVANFEITLALF